MSHFGRGRERPGVSIEELIATVRRESAAAISTADAFFQDPPSRQVLTVPRRFPDPDELPGQQARSPRDQDTRPQQAGGPA